MEPTIGQRLNTLKAHSGLSLAEIAKRGGYRGASSIQKLFRDDYNPTELPRFTARKLMDALVGTGNPPIQPAEIWHMTDELLDSIDNAFARSSVQQHANDTVIFLDATERSGSTLTTANGHQIPLFVKKDSDDIAYFANPAHLRHLGLGAFYVTIGNMWPRFEEGEIAIYAGRRPAKPGDDVVVTLIDDIYLDGAMILGKLLLMHEDEVQIRQLSPSDVIVIPRSEVISVKPLLTRSDMLPSVGTNPNQKD